MSIEEERKQIELNFFGSTKVTRAVLPDMKLNPGGGHVVFVSSQGGLIGLYGLSTYCASKFAIRGFAESLAMGKCLVHGEDHRKEWKDNRIFISYN